MILFIVGSLLVGGLICLLAGTTRPWIVQMAYAVAILSSVTIASKIVPIAPEFGVNYAVSASIGLFSMTFLLTDYLSEVFGKKYSMQALMGTFVGYGVFLFATQFAVYVQPADFWQANQENFAGTLGLIPRITLASVLAFLFGQWTDITVYHLVQEKAPKLGLAGRNNLSTIAGQTVDSIVFYSVGFYGLVPNIVELIVATCIIKYAIALADTPVIYAVVHIANRKKQREAA